MIAQLLIPAAGMGTRLGCAGPKALVELEGESLLLRSLRRFSVLGMAEGAVVLCPPGYVKVFQEHLAEHFPDHAVTVVEGGAERQTSVLNGLEALNPETEMVAIHDAARPFVAVESIQAALEAAREIGAATVAVPVIDTILQGIEGDFLEHTPDRAQLWACQTPQVFQTQLIRDAHLWAKAEGISVTDDATLVRRRGYPVKLVQGTHTNIKITTPTDLVIGAAFIREGIQ